MAANSIKIGLDFIAEIPASKRFGVMNEELSSSSRLRQVLTGQSRQQLFGLQRLDRDKLRMPFQI
ncbi:MAG TPA: hypothetical protein PLK30_21515 [Blastocatellia bacterium]|nr:hypothetical protein [Blastocatellia bacterium]